MAPVYGDWRDSNPRPLESQSSDLPTDLQPQSGGRDRTCDIEGQSLAHYHLCYARTCSVGLLMSCVVHTQTEGIEPSPAGLEPAWPPWPDPLVWLVSRPSPNARSTQPAALPREGIRAVLFSQDPPAPWTARVPTQWFVIRLSFAQATRDESRRSRSGHTRRVST